MSFARFAGKKARFAIVVAAASGAVACSGLLGLTDPALDDGLDDGGNPANDGGTGPDGIGPIGDSGGPDAPFTCETDLTSDKKNCGACGHDCLGGDCKASQCQPVLMIDNANIGPYGMLVQGSTLYFTNNYGSLSSFMSIDKMAVSTTASFKTIKQFNSDTDGYPFQLAAVGTTFYVALYSPDTSTATGQYLGGIWRCDTSTCTQVQSNLSSYAIGSDDAGTVGWGALYTNPDGGDDLNRIDLTRNNFAAVTNLLKSPDGDDVVSSIAIENGTLYFGAPSGVYMRPLDGGSGRQISDVSGVQIAAHEGTIYFTTNGNVRAVQSSSTDPTQNVLIAGPFQESSGIAVDDQSVYAVDEGDRSNPDDAGSALVRCPLAGCGATSPAVLSAGQLGNVSAVTVDDKAIYWGTGAPGRIYRLAK